MTYHLELYPWQSTAWKRMIESFDRLVHATLITGIEGIGKFRFASKLAMALLCAAPDGKPCGQCRNCKLFSAATHPDLHVLTSEAKLEFLDSTMQSFAERYLEDERARTKRKTRRTSIVVDQIRALIESANVKPHISDNKVFLVDPIDSMTIAAANSLLKILEEPPPNTFLILIAENHQHLLPTITSRCQKLNFSEPDRTTTEIWLKKQNLDSNAIDAILDSGKGPVLGLRRSRNKEFIRSSDFIDQLLKHFNHVRNDDILSLVELGVQLGESECLGELHLLVSNMIREASDQGVGNDSTDTNLTGIARRTNIKKLYSLYDHIGFLSHQNKVGGMDKTLLVEDALLAIEAIVD